MGFGDDMMKYDGIKHLGYDKIWPKKKLYELYDEELLVSGKSPK